MDTLPPELLFSILQWAPKELFNGTIALVCWQWRDVIRLGSMRHFLFSNRLYAYEKKWILPKTLTREAFGFRDFARCSLAVGQDGRIYSGSDGCIIHVWNGTDGTHLQTLNGHTWNVYALAVGKNSHIYSGCRPSLSR